MEAVAQHFIFLDSATSLFECLYFCRLFKFTFCSTRLRALLYTSRVQGLRPLALFNKLLLLIKKKKLRRT
jgi:hypothetical protein